MGYRTGLVALALLLCTGCTSLVGRDGSGEMLRISDPTPPLRINARSPWYTIDPDAPRLYTDFCGWDTVAGERRSHLEVHRQALRMIHEAEDLIVFSFFLFDNLYAESEAPIDIVGQITEALIAKKQQNPDMTIVLVLDLFHKGWAHRRSPAIEKLRGHGIDVFYSDRLDTRAASRDGLWEGANELGRAVDELTFGITAAISDAVGLIPLPIIGISLDGEPIRLGTLTNAAFLKANHRKLLVTRRAGEYQALVTSWNPHNYSALHENHAVTIDGPIAAYIYMVLREDVIRSLGLGGRYVEFAPGRDRAYRRTYLDDRLPPLEPAAWAADTPDIDDAANGAATPPQAAFATEQAIETMILERLEAVGPGDRIRIQMFFLSHLPVLDALVDAAGRSGEPVQVLLDPNRVSINYARDGTPNAQVAEYLYQRAKVAGVDIQVRWYATHGEQNHAKAMSITNERTGDRWLTLGSANFSRKNLAGINLEANLFFRNVDPISRRFDEQFDRLWGNLDEGVEYSIAWDDPRYNYHRHGGMAKWAAPQTVLGVIPVADHEGHLRRLEQELVHW